jgi:hypothetical protein
VAGDSKADAGSIRSAIRWGLLLAAVATIGFRLSRVAHEFREWREAVRFGDSSAADAWRTSLMIDSIGSLIVLAFGLAVFYGLRPRGTSQP